MIHQKTWMRNYSKLISLKSAVRLTVNVIGALLYLHFSMPLWDQYELADVPGAGAGDPIIWGLTAFPILIFFCAYEFLLGRLWQHLVLQNKKMEIELHGLSRPSDMGNFCKY